MSKSRILVCYIFISVIFSVLLLRYSYIQLFGHIAYQKQSINNYSSIVPMPPVRGAIIDSNGITLATNVVSYAIGILTKDYKKSTNIFDNLSRYANITELDKKRFFRQLKMAKNYDITILKDDLSNTEIAKLTAHSYEFPNLIIFARTKRYYPFADSYAHSLGYVGKVSAKELTSLSKNNQANEYLNNDYVGKNGLEKFYESQLRGSLGKKIIQTDAHGNEITLISNTPATDGNSIKLTIDNGLQQFANQALGQNNGAIVAIDTTNGGILAFVSKPGFDPNWFIDGIDNIDWNDLRDDPNTPLVNRASQSSFPPGSTFKPFLGIAALHLKFRTPSSTTFDPGYFMLPNSSHKFRDNDHPNGLGVVDMEHAIAVSSDTYFYKLAYDMGIDNIDKGLTKFGFGNKTGIDLPEEASGLLPSREWKQKRFSKDPYQRSWLPADSITIGIGQGFNHYTPLQLAYATSIIANDGLAIKPHFIKEIIPSNTKDNKPILYNIESHQVGISNANFQFIKKSMEMVVTSGTARQISYGLKYTMAGKTGTAQVVSTLKNSRKQKFAGKKYRDHAWFIAFAPVENPKIAIAILVENGGFGAASAAPIARQLFDYYLVNHNKTNPS